MDKYDNLGIIGEGSYGVVIKCKHKQSGQLVAIKKFLETEDDPAVKKIALREVRMLKRLRHEHLINLIEVFRRKRKLYLVFEYVDHTILEELEENPSGLGEEVARKHVFQVVRAINFCHQNNIIHRDIKPENILVSKMGVIKLCDFGFARLMAAQGEIYTDYVATRWYRAPELLVGDPAYGKEVDIWAIGCLYAEMLTGDPLFPGDSDIDQIYHITKCFGSLCSRHKELISKNPIFSGVNMSNSQPTGLKSSFPHWSDNSMNFVSACLNVDPNKRPTTEELAKYPLFSHDNFNTWFLHDLQQKLQEEFISNPLLKTRKSVPSASKIKKAAEEILNKRNNEKTSVELRQRSVKSGGDNEDLFDEVLKKSQVYSQKYSTGTGVNKNSGNTKNLDQNFRLSISSEKRNNTSAKSDLSITPTGAFDEDDLLNTSMDILSPQRLKERRLKGEFSTKNSGMKRFDGFEQGLNNFHIQAKSVGNENMRKSPPNKKTKKTNLDFSLDSPKILSKDSNKFAESSDKFMFLERAFNRAFHFEDGPQSLTSVPVKDQTRLISHENTAANIKRSVMEDFWLPKVSGATNKGKKGGKNSSGNFQHLVEGVKTASETKRKNLPNV